MFDIFKMVKMVIASLFGKTACEQYPFKQPKRFELSKGSIIIDPPKCILCTLCDKKCPTGAIKVDRNKRTWEINRFKCVLCRSCIENCRPKCLLMGNKCSIPEEKITPELVNIPIVEEKSKNA